MANASVLRLPRPRFKGRISVEEAILGRRSIRRFSSKPLSLDDVSQLLWAAQGVTEPESGGRSAPSAGATYPLEVFLFVREGGVKEVAAGAYRYRPLDNSLVNVAAGDRYKELVKSGLDQDFIGEAPINIVLAARYERTTSR